MTNRSYWKIQKFNFPIPYDIVKRIFIILYEYNIEVYFHEKEHCLEEIKINLSDINSTTDLTKIYIRNGYHYYSILSIFGQSYGQDFRNYNQSNLHYVLRAMCIDTSLFRDIFKEILQIHDLYAAKHKLPLQQLCYLMDINENELPDIVISNLQNWNINID